MAHYDQRYGHPAAAAAAQQQYHHHQQQHHHHVVPRYPEDIFQLPEARRLETIRELRRLAQDGVVYSDRYEDDAFEFRHVILPRPMLARGVPVHRFLSEEEWHTIGVTQSPGWVQFLMHAAEPHVLIFRRPLTAAAREAKVAKHAELEASRARAIELVRELRQRTAASRACGSSQAALAAKFHHDAFSEDNDDDLPVRDPVKPPRGPLAPAFPLSPSSAGAAGPLAPLRVA